MKAFKSIALIPAAGMGKRMGASINKQYLQLSGMPIVARTISVFERSALIDAIFLVIPEDEIPYCQKYVVDEYNFKKIAAIIPGGCERQNSVMNGLIAIKEIASDDDVILIHDGVRPFITEDLLKKSINAARLQDGAVVAVQAKDTIKIVNEGIISNTPPREQLWQAQTPQSFRFGKIYSAYLSAEKDAFCGTDDSSLLEISGGKVHIIRGDYRNIKITTPEDLILAEVFLTNLERELN